MDIDIGKIEQIKVWHENLDFDSGWFLDFVIIRKKYSTGHTVSKIYVQRLKLISQVLYHQIHDHIKKNLSVQVIPLILKQNTNLFFLLFLSNYCKRCSIWDP